MADPVRLLAEMIAAKARRTGMPLALRAFPVVEAYAQTLDACALDARRLTLADVIAARDAAEGLLAADCSTAPLERETPDRLADKPFRDHGDIAAFIDERIMDIAGSAVPQSDLFAAFQDWSRERFRPGRIFTNFVMAVDFWLEREVRDGRIVYPGIALVSAADVQAAGTVGVPSAIEAVL